VPANWAPKGKLFAVGLSGITERAEVRRATIDARVAKVAELVAAEPDEPWLLWCGLNDEADRLRRAIPDAVEVRGSDSPEVKAERLLDFAEGRTRVLVTKTDIAGFGLNLQRCARMAFVGINDSYQSYFQAIRRCWRFGQTREVRAYVVISDVEMDIYNNVLRKEAEAAVMTRELIAHVAEYERQELGSGAEDEDPFRPTRPLLIPDWLYNDEEAA
jgi:superfamily II DNA/RNA helicase